MSRIELSWGGGVFDILLDVATGRLHAYAHAAAAVVIHSLFGGKNYYRSKSGLSGAGFIPERLGIVKIQGYRTDTISAPWITPEALASGPEIGGWRIVAPFEYGWGLGAPENWPIVATRGDGYYFLTPQEVMPLLGGLTKDCFSEQSLTARLIKRPGEEMIQYPMRYWVRDPASHWRGMRKVLEALNMKSLRFEGAPEPSSNEFWSRLGLHPLPDGRVYKVTNGICRASYSREQVATVEGLQAAAPRNVRVLAPNVYVQGEFGSGFTAVGLFCFGGEEIDYEVALDETRAMRVIGGATPWGEGELCDVVAELEAGARRKAEQDRLNRLSREEREREEADIARSLAELASENGDVVVTFADSLAAGNCEPGTSQFRDRAFPGRQEVKLAELIPHLANGNVRRVVEWKLRQLTKGA